MVAAGAEKAMLDAADHLALAFHRFLAGEIVGPFSILLNERRYPLSTPSWKVTPADSRSTSRPSPSTAFDKSLAVCAAFPSKLRPSDLERAGGRESLSTAHGFYIYRSGRLVVPGGWFKIVPADELIRLARIRVDVPVELDHLWKIDIRKAVAEPPPALRPHLKRIVGDVTLRSARSTSRELRNQTPNASRYGGGMISETKVRPGRSTVSIRLSVIPRWQRGTVPLGGATEIT